jgi:hypothetical protein
VFRYFGLGDIDKSMSGSLFHKSGFCVELGAIDQVSCSDALFLELRLIWKRVLFLPSHLLFQKLQKVSQEATFNQSPHL